LVEKYTPLYLKYRPQSLADLVGQRSVTQTLVNAIEYDRISHAYLFTGPRGTGKTSSARILAKSLNCEKGPTTTPCQACPQCVEIREGTSPAVFELDAASNNSVDDARVLIERAPLVAQGGRNKLYIIDECHMLTKEAFNALLKTIEEPPPNVIFILATTEEHKVPPTIVSRCQRLMFRLVNQDELKNHLRYVAKQESINIDDGAIELIARRSGGGLRDALGLLDQAGLLSTSEKPLAVQDLLALVGAVQEDTLLQISAGIQASDGSAVLNAVHCLLIDGREPAILIQELSKHFLNLARACYNQSSPKSAGSVHTILGSPTYLSALAEQAHDYDPAEIAQIVEVLDKLEQNVRRSSQPAMNLEIGLLSVCHRHDILMLRELQGRMFQLEEALIENGIELPYLRSGSARPAVVAKPSPRTATPSLVPAQIRQQPVVVPSVSLFAQPLAPSSAPPPVPSAALTSAPSLHAQAGDTVFAPAVNARSQASGQAISDIAGSTLSDSHGPALPQTESAVTAPEAEAAASSSAGPAIAVPPATALAAHVTKAPMVDEDLGGEDPPWEEDFSESNAGANNAAQEAAGETEDASLSEETPHCAGVAASAGVSDDERMADSSRIDEFADQAAAQPAAPGVVAESPLQAATEPSQADQVSLDEIWSDLKDALQTRHIPTYSLISTQAFPVAFEKNDLTIGVRKENMQKMLEGKADHIKAAFTAFSGKSITVRVKVIGQPGQGSQSRQARASASSGSPPGRASRQAASPGGLDQEEQDESEGRRPSSTYAPSSQRGLVAAAYAPNRGEPSSFSGQAGATTESPETARTRAPNRDSTAERASPSSPQRWQETSEAVRTSEFVSGSASEPADPSMIHEAYRLFEGPGSRLIG
jgi:DNA polymerase-3 subunit gamma/tau